METMIVRLVARPTLTAAMLALAVALVVVLIWLGVQIGDATRIAGSETSPFRWA